MQPVKVIVIQLIVNILNLSCRDEGEMEADQQKEEGKCSVTEVHGGSG